jgi:alpha-galactosidase
LLWQAHGEADDLLLLLYRISPQSWRHAPSVRLPMLDPSRRYRIDGNEYHGAWLIAEGLPTQPMKAERFQLIEVKSL